MAEYAPHPAYKEEDQFLAAEANNVETGIQEALDAEKDLGSVSGVVKLDLSQARTFRCKLTGATTFQVINAPKRPTRVNLYPTQDATGGRTWAIEGIEWVTTEPTFSTAANAKAFVPVLVLATGAIVGFGQSSTGGSLVGKTTASATVLGEGAGAVLTTTATLVGVNAGAALTTGEANTAVGKNALLTNKTGKGNVAIGSNALNKQTGSEATAVGYEALVQNTANNVTAVGSFALIANTTGTGNTAVGRSTLFTNKTGTNSTAIGAASLELATGSANTALGTAAGNRITTGEENTALGRGAMESGTTTAQSTGVGCKALFNLETGSKNTALGYKAGGALKVGSGNVFIGWEAGAQELGSHKLYIANSNTTTPLIYGDLELNELTLTPTGGKVGLMGAAPVARQTLTGAKGGNAALTSVIAALVAYGLATDTTT